MLPKSTRQEAIANNLANSEVPGFKKDIIEIDNQIAKEIKQGIIAAPEGQDMQDEDENTDINIGDN